MSLRLYWSLKISYRSPCNVNLRIIIRLKQDLLTLHLFVLSRSSCLRFDCILFMVSLVMSRRKHQPQEGRLFGGCNLLPFLSARHFYKRFRRSRRGEKRGAHFFWHCQLLYRLPSQKTFHSSE